MIRDAGPADRAAIEALTLAAYEQYATVLAPRLWAAYRQNIVATLADVTAATQIVVEDDGALVGTALLYPARAPMGEAGSGRHTTLVHPEVRLLAVSPTARGGGVGRQLMEECVRRARAAGAPALTLHTTDMMSAAVRLYERMGFARATELDFEVAAGVLVKGYHLPL